MGYSFNLTKYKNKKVEINGMVFDSKKEASRYWELLMLQDGGVIKDLEVHKKYSLIPSQKGVIRNERPVYYVADFVYFDIEQNKTIIEDVKSEATKKDRVYRIKKRFMAKKGLSITEV